MSEIENIGYQERLRYFCFSLLKKRMMHRILNRLLVVMLALPTVAQSRGTVPADEFLKSLFPGSSVVRARLDGKDSVKLLRDISLRGEKWFIPLEEIVQLNLNTSLAIMALPIHRYLPASDDRGFTTRLPDSIFPKPKLEQVIFYNRKNNTFLGKPEGFPLASDGWVNWVKVGEIHPVNTSKNAAVIRYTTGELHKIQVVVFEKGKVFTSAVLEEQELGGLSGYDATVEYADWTQNGRAISAQVTKTCNEPDPKQCMELGMTPGTTSKSVTVLQLPE